MKFQGLFVGIDRYLHAGWLNCAVRDAKAMHAAFTDNFGGNSVLLLDKDANRAKIEQSFQSLKGCEPDDFVVIFFSGHGSETHELVTFDSEPNNLSTSGIPLDLFTEWIKIIPSKRILCVLDCCFSGGAAAKVLRIDTKSKDVRSLDSYLNDIQGDGRLILTASGVHEEAWEDSKLGHGLLTYYFLEAIFSEKNLDTNNSVPLLPLIRQVAKAVEEGSKKLRKSQTPTVRGTFDASYSLPIFTRGKRYKELFPVTINPTVSSEINSLQEFGFPVELIAEIKKSIPSLNKMQVLAINTYGALSGENVLVSAPTSSGKTLIGELATIHGSLRRKRAIFLFPLRALVNDKYEYFNRVYGTYGITTIRATGEISDEIPALMLGQYDICLMTYEKFANMVLATPHVLSQVDTVVVDEIQMISNEGRGINLEFILTLLKVQKRRGVVPQVIALSAVLGETNGFEDWLEAKRLNWNKRPVPLEEGIICGDGRYRYMDPEGNEKVEENYIQRTFTKGSSQDWIIPLVKRLVEDGQQVIVFRKQKSIAQSTAKYLARNLNLSTAQEALDQLPIGDVSAASQDLREALIGGVACHTSNLNRDERIVVENEFRRKDTKLRVIAATPTLAMGVNMPAEAVIIEGLAHPPNNTPYAVAEYKNMVGRAGRLGMSDKGRAYIIATSVRDEHDYWNRYVGGSLEPLVSRFLQSDDPRSLILRVLVTAPKKSDGLTEEEIIDFLELSFGVFLLKREQKDWGWDRASLSQRLHDLASNELVKSDKSGRFTLTPLGRLAGEGGVEVETIINIASLVKILPPQHLSDPTLLAIMQKSIEVQQTYLPFNKRGINTEHVRWHQELRNQNISELILGKLAPIEAKKATACLLWVSGLETVQIEAHLTQHLPRKDASGEIFSVTSRTRDILPTLIQVVQIIHPEIELGNRSQRLQSRLELGLPSEVTEIAIHSGTALTRSDYLNLQNSKLNTISAIKSAADDTIVNALKVSRNIDQKLIALKRAVRLHEAQSAIETQIPLIPPYKE